MTAAIYVARVPPQSGADIGSQLDALPVGPVHRKVVVAIGMVTTAAANVFSNGYHAYQAEIFPSDVRATAVGWTYSLSRLSSAALPFMLIPVLDRCGATAMFAVVVTALAIAVAALVACGPRTAGRSLEDINPV